MTVSRIAPVIASAALYWTDFRGLGKTFWSLRNNPIVLPTLLDVFCMLLKIEFYIQKHAQVFWISNWCSQRWTWKQDDLTFEVFEKKKTCTCFLMSGLKLIFHWKVQLPIFIRSLFKSIPVWFTSSATEKSEVSSANVLGLELNP